MKAASRNHRRFETSRKLRGTNPCAPSFDGLQQYGRGLEGFDTHHA